MSPTQLPDTQGGECPPSPSSTELQGVYSACLRHQLAVSLAKSGLRGRTLLVTSLEVWNSPLETRTVMQPHSNNSLFLRQAPAICCPGLGSQMCVRMHHAASDPAATLRPGPPALAIGFENNV